MVRCGVGFIGLLLPCVSFAQVPATTPPVSVHASYETYAAGIHIADVNAGFSFGPWTYQMSLNWQTTGMVGLLFRGHQTDRVTGSWRGDLAVPAEFVGRGEWRGEQRLADIDYRQGRPVVRELVPANTEEREAVPDALQANTIDTLSALAELIRVMGDTGQCETSAHTYDGRRAVEIEAHTAGTETLEPTSRSSFSGQTSRCDFSGRMLAGFKFGDDRERESKPMHGSAWLAAVVPGGPPLPVRMAFQTRWFGDATMYLTGVGAGSDFAIAGAK